MKIISSFSSIVSLIIVNLIPLYGVYFYGWNVFALLFLYWLENVCIGVSTICKMMKAEGIGFPFQSLGRAHTTTISVFTNSIKRSFFIPFFLMHFGLFTLVHGVFVLAFFFTLDAPWLGILLAFLSMCVSHAISYHTNFIAKQEYQRVSVERLFVSPYPRVIVMHLTVILGAIFAFSDGEPVGAMVILVVLKTVTDLGAHLLEHSRIGREKIALISNYPN